MSVGKTYSPRQHIVFLGNNSAVSICYPEMGCQGDIVPESL